MRTIARAPMYGALIALTSTGCGVEPPRGPTEPDARNAAAASAGFSDWSMPVALPAPINLPLYNDQQPSLSKDGLALYFNSNRPEHEQDLVTDANIWVATRECVDCPWGDPIPLGPPVNGPATDATPELTRDGHVLFFLSNRIAAQGNDIYTSRRTHVHGGEWSMPVPLGPEVNTTGANEGSPTLLVTDDGSRTQLYFHRQVGPAGQPSGDIFLSELQDDDTWGVATVVAELNDPAGGADQRPTLSRNGLEIYFWSGRDAGRGTVGSGYIWHSARGSTSDPWETPTLAPDPVNIRSAIQPYLYARGHTESLYIVHNNGTPPRLDLDIVVTTRTRRP
jgi:hypothetical protein